MPRAVQKLLSSSRPLVFGMIHVQALPRTPAYKDPLFVTLQKVREEASIYIRSGVDGIIVENMHDVPYVKPPASPEITAAMTLACQEVANMCKDKDTLLGVQILAACNKEALAVASVTGFDFIRAEGFVFSHVADEGWIDACAGKLLRYRSQLPGPEIAVFADIKKKHSSHTITSDVSIETTAKDAEFNRADGVIVTGTATGDPAKKKELIRVRKSCKLPVLIGSGVNFENVSNYVDAHGLIVGTEFKKEGHWSGDLDERKIRSFMNKVSKLKR
ncbi:unnamed protein product [Caenorhabditis auriculariae]|uniref:Uncharacterized protein n=1 Tax=Caenorhabditis auriculariae TaxID=2777116 RepID=A0A8S1GV18_9PELO|nr:unnamed protein product [Caenorhabditis auriculariae]